MGPYRPCFTKVAMPVSDWMKTTFAAASVSLTYLESFRLQLFRPILGYSVPPFFFRFSL